MTTVADEQAARPVVEALLLAGIGPGLRPGPGGVEVTVVRGEGARARAALGLGDAEAEDGIEAVPPAARPGAAPTVAPSWPAEDAALTPGAAAARAAAVAADLAGRSGTNARKARLDRAGVDTASSRSSRRSTFVYLGVFLLALVLIPAVAFFISFKAAGG